MFRDIRKPVAKRNCGRTIIGRPIIALSSGMPIGMVTSHRLTFDCLTEQCSFLPVSATRAVRRSTTPCRRFPDVGTGDRVRQLREPQAVGPNMAREVRVLL